MTTHNKIKTFPAPYSINFMVVPVLRILLHQVTGRPDEEPVLGAELTLEGMVYGREEKYFGGIG